MRPRTSSMLGWGAVVLVAGLAIPVRPVSADASACPASLAWYFHHGQGGYRTIEAFAYDTTFITDGYDPAHVYFDRTLARFSLSATGALSAGVRVIEAFDVVGVPPGTAVEATLFLRLDGAVLQNCGGSGCTMSFGGTLVSGTRTASVAADLLGPCGGCHQEMDTTLVLPVTLVAGSPVQAEFELVYRTTWVGWGDAQATGWYGISGMPLGVRAIACPGTDVTPARRTTWGSLKTLYR